MARVPRRQERSDPGGAATCGPASPSSNGQGPEHISVSTGNLQIHVSGPSGGSYDPTPVLSYNSLVGEPGAVADNWSETYEQMVDEMSPNTADLVKSGGQVFRYADEDSDGTLVR